MDDGSVVADEGSRELMDLSNLTRELPEGVIDVRTEYHYYDDTEDQSYWTGTTTFRVKPFGTYEKEKKYELDQEPERKRALTRGQKKGLLKEVENLEDTDCALWSILTRRPAHLPKKWSFVLELFCGCALLTRMCQAQGYTTCEPMDVNTGWNVFNAAHAEKVIDEQNPYLVTMAFPCGPWSAWQRMVPPELVQEKRRKWIPVLRWVKSIVWRQRRKGGVSLLENPWGSEAWSTRELQSLEEDTLRSENSFQVLRIDLCRSGLRDADNGLPHLKPTGVGTDSEGVQKQFEGVRCTGDHEHQPLEGSNSKGPRTRQAARWTPKFCRKIIRGIQDDLNLSVKRAFMAENREETLEEESRQPLDAVVNPEDLGTSRPTEAEAERSFQAEESLEEIRRIEEPDFEKHRRNEWLRLPKQERIGIRRLHAMTSHATRPQLQRMLRYSNAPSSVVTAVKYFRCAACERLEKEKRPAQVKTPSPYTFGEEVGLDIFEIKDAAGDRYQILHCVCSGTTFQVGVVLGRAAGVPSSRSCLDAFLRMWTTWAGIPRSIVVDRGTHNRGVFQMELEKMGATFREVATEAPFQLGRTERHGGLLKNMMNRVVHATQSTGPSELQMVLVQCLDTKNQHGNMGGFSPAQWVLGRNPTHGVWSQDDEIQSVVQDEDPQSTFNRRAAIREAARSAWAQEDSYKRVRRALLRQGGAEGQVFRQGDLVSFMRRKGGSPKWYGPARVLTQEGKNVWIMHGGVPILTADNMIRPSSSEEHLEKELLGHRKGNKRARGWIHEEVRQPHQLAGGVQPSYMDLRNRGDEGESFEEIIGYKPRTGGAQAVTERGDEDGEESPKRMRELVREEEEKEQQEQQQEEEVSLVGTEEIDAILGPEAPSGGVTVVPPEQMPINNLDMMQMIEGGPRRTPESKEESAAEKTLRQRSRSPPERVRREFNAFMAKRSNPQTTGELRYEKETDEVKKAIDEARAKEWANWVKYRATRTPTAEEVSKMMSEGKRAIPMRWVDIDKNAKLRVEGGPVVEPKMKSRLVLRGDLEPGDYRVDCPTATLVATHLVLSYAASTGRTLHAGDITAAFLQGTPISRELLMRVPSSGIPATSGTGEDYAVEPGGYLIALMSIYGSRDAPRGFWLALREEMTKNNLREIEPAFYALSDDQHQLHGLAVTHVDDILWCGDAQMDQVMTKIQRRFTFGSIEEDNFRFCGRKVMSNDKYTLRFLHQSCWPR